MITDDCGNMILTFLGTGTSTGVPMIGCHCDTCRSTDPRDKRLRAAAVISAGGRSILIDCGPDIRTQILSNNIGRLECLLVTHSHYDHVGGIDDLRPYCYPDGFDMFCKSDVSKDLHQKVPYCFAEHPYPGAPVLHTRIIEPMRQFEVGGFSILPLPVNHYLIDIVGFRIGNLAYITDAKVVPGCTIDAIKGVDTLVINALRKKEHISHINLSEALGIINIVKPRMAYLTHLSHDMGRHAEVSKELPHNVKLAYDGLTITVPPCVG